MRWRVRRPAADLVRFVMRLVYDGSRHRTPAARGDSGGAVRRAARAAACRLAGGRRRLRTAAQLPALADRERDHLAGFGSRRLERGAMRIPDGARGMAGGLGELGPGHGAEELADVVDDHRELLGVRLAMAASIPIAARGLTLGSERREPAGDRLPLAGIRDSTPRCLDILGGMARVPCRREDDRDGGFA